MIVLFLHGWTSVPGGVKPTYLKEHGHTVLNPVLPDNDMAQAIQIAQAEFDRHRPEVVVGSSRGGAVAMNMDSGNTRLVLLCPAWNKYGKARTVKPGTVILHSRADEVIPFSESEELVRNSGLPASALIEVGSDHRLADAESLASMLRACKKGGTEPEVPSFGVREASATYTERRAAYGVVIGEGETIAAVQGPSGHLWLPGGGTLAGESAEETLAREVGEELARTVRLIHRIGEAIQFFFAADDDRHYRMLAEFFRIELGESMSTSPQHEICWIPQEQTKGLFFHECHGWAVEQAAVQQGRTSTMLLFDDEPS